MAALVACEAATNGHAGAGRPQSASLPASHRQWSPLPPSRHGLRYRSLLPSRRPPARDRELADFAAALTGKSEDFQTATGINYSLAELYRLLAEDKIAPRRAAVLAYINNLLLRTLPAINDENDFQSGEEISAAILRGAPRPQRD